MSGPDKAGDAAAASLSIAPPLLRVEGVRAGYGNIEALHGIDLEVRQGEIVCLIGANGAGKTSTLMTICGCVKTRTGRITFAGQDITGMASDRIVRLGLAQSPEGRKIFPRLTVLENLEMGAFIRNDKVEIARDIERVIGLFPILGERRRRRAARCRAASSRCWRSAAR